MSAPKAPTQHLVEKQKLGSSSSSEDGTTSVGDRDFQQEHEILELVRRYTTQSVQQNHGSPFDAAQGSPLDPQSDQFRAKDWSRSYYNLKYSGEEAISRVAGFAFENLNVWGEGSPTDFQSTVGNTILKFPALFGKGNQRIEILRDIDGLLLPGEQLCVLGPPGSVSLPKTSHNR